MKISEIIVEPREGHQLDEGMMDTIKSKLSGVYQKLNKMPGFAKVVQQVKTHSGELNKIASVLQAKSQGGQLTKQDVLATVMPLANTVSAEMGGGKVGNSDSPMLDSLVNMMISSLSGSKQAVQESKMVLNEDIGLGIGILLTLIVGAWMASNYSKAEEKRKADIAKYDKSRAEWKEKYETDNDREYEKKLKQNAVQKEKERERNNQTGPGFWTGVGRGTEYKMLARQYKENRSEMTYAQKRRMEELYNQGYR